MLDYILVNVKYYFTLNLVKLLISKGNMEKAITEILENKVEEDFSQDFEFQFFFQFSGGQKGPLLTNSGAPNGLR